MFSRFFSRMLQDTKRARESTTRVVAPAKKSTSGKLSVMPADGTNAAFAITGLRHSRWQLLHNVILPFATSRCGVASRERCEGCSRHQQRWPSLFWERRPAVVEARGRLSTVVVTAAPHQLANGNPGPLTALARSRSGSRSPSAAAFKMRSARIGRQVTACCSAGRLAQVRSRVVRNSATVSGSK
jgi:hypothetical protein